MAETKINKTRRSTGRLRASVRLKWKNKFTIKKVIFNQLWTFLSKVFRGLFDPIRGYKTLNQSFKKSVDFERENRHASHFGKDQRMLTPNQIKARIPTPDNDCL